LVPPDAFAIIIGAMKSGTTTLYAHLAGHPQVCPCRVKEPEFFCTHQGHAPPGVSEYEELWDFDAAVHRWAIEASTGYTKYPWEEGVPERMDEYGIRPRMIYIMRDPFKRIESHHDSMLPSPRVRRRILDEHHINTSDYHLQLSRYRRVWPDAEILLLDFARLREDPGEVVAEACRFLEVAPMEVLQSDLHANATPPQAPLLKAYGKLMSSSGLSNPLPSGLKSRVRELVVRLFARRRRHLTARERSIVRERLAPGMRKLQDETGFDVSKWGF
jgi:hypothetical protein